MKKRKPTGVWIVFDKNDYPIGMGTSEEAAWDDASLNSPKIKELLVKDKSICLPMTRAQETYEKRRT